MNRNINNIGILDIRNASSKEIRSLGDIENVGVLIYSGDTAEYLNELKIRSIGCSIKMDEDFLPVTGGIRINKNYLSSIEDNINLIIAGQLSVDKDVSIDELDQKISKIVVSGDIVCPEKLLSIVQKKAKVFSGAIRTFSDETRLIVGRISVNNEYLNSLDDDTVLSVSGIIEITEEIDMNLLLNKVKRLELSGKVVLREEYIKDFLSRVKGNVSTIIIPRGYRYIKEDLVLDRFSIRRFKGDKIFIKGNLILKKDISSEIFNQAFKAIHSEGNVICPDALAEDIYDVFEKVSRFITYFGRLVEVDGEYILTAGEIDYSDDKIVYLVNGILDIEKDVSLEQLQKVESFINMGMISVFKEQFGIVQTRTVVKEGVITTKEEEDELSGSIGHLVL